MRLGDSTDQDLLDRIKAVRGKIDEIETNFPVHTWALGGASLWPMLKVRILMSENLKALHGSGILFRPSTRAMLKAQLGTAARSSLSRLVKGRRYNLPTGVRCHPNILICALGSAFIKTSVGWTIPLIEPFLRHARKSGQTVQLMLFDGKMLPASNLQFEFSHLVSNGHVFVHDMERKLFGFRQKVSRIELEGLSGFRKVMCELNASMSKSEAVGLTSRLLSIQNSTQLLLNICQPDIVLVQGAYGGFGQALCAAAFHAGIPVYDIQHGVQGPHHEAYTFSNQVAMTATTLPTGYLCWSNAGANHLKSWVKSPDLVFAGAPFSLLAEHVKAAVNMPSIDPSFGKKTLYLAARGERPSAFEALSQRLSGEANLVWCQHPLSVSPLLHAAIAQDRMPSDLISEARDAECAVVSLSSSALEASALGIPVVVQSLYGQHLLETELKGERVTFGVLDKSVLRTVCAREDRSDHLEVLNARFENMWDAVLRSIEPRSRSVS